MNRAAAAALLAVALLGCDGDPPPSPGAQVGPLPTLADGVEEPCPDGGGEDHALGNPDRGGPFATFAVAGEGEVWVTARSFEHGGMFDPETGTTAIDVGDAAAPPTYDEQRSAVSNVMVSLLVQEGTWGSLQLEPGTYWLWTTTGSDVVLRTCDPGRLSDVTPVP